MRIGIGQMNSRLEKDENLKSAESLIDKLAAAGADLVVLPEYFNFIGPEDLWQDNAEELENSPSLKRIQKKAVHHKIHILSGTIMEQSEGLLHNTAVLFNPEGESVAQYRKIHLFDVEVPGGRRYVESENITAGDHTVVLTIDGVCFGLATCYDLRFPELFRELADKGAEVLLVPAAFTMMTGRDHWELLLRARAVENLCYVAAADQFGSCPPNHLSYGRSMIIDPWGTVIAQASDGVGVITADLDLDHLKKLRTGFPVLNHIRKDIFSGH